MPKISRRPNKRRGSNAPRILVSCLIVALIGGLYLSSTRVRVVEALSITTLGVPITQNFDTLPASGSATFTNDTTLPGWYSARTGTGTTIVANDGSSNAGNLYSYGTGTNTDRALGSLGSGNAAIGNLFWGIVLTNNSGSTITSLDVAYTGEQWRNSAAAAQTVAFSYTTGASFTGTLAEFQAAGTAVTQLDFTGPITGGAAGALNGNLVANRTAISFTIGGLSLANGQAIFLRWSDPDHTGADHGLSIDDFSVTPSGAPVTDTAPSVSSTNPANSATGVPLASNISITFSEPVTAPAGAFSISCASSGAHAFSLSGGPTTFTLDPTVNFSSNEVCTVTVDDAQVADVDSNDPPDNMAADYIFSFTSVDVAACGAAFTPTYTIQGSGTASPLVATSVTTEGIVIGDFQGSSNLSGFYIQDPTGDANAATSDGIFVFDGASPTTDVALGDRVRVSGMVAETFNNTQIVPTGIIICSTGNVLPAPVNYDLPEPVNNDLERVENMLVTFSETLTVTGNFNLGRFGEAVLSSDGREFQQNNFDRTNSVAALAVADLNLRRYVVLDDGRTTQNVDPTAYFDASNTRRVGDTVTGLTGVLTFDFSEYRLQPTTTPVFVSANARTAAPASVGGTVKVSSFNVLNYFNGNGAGGGFPTSRGATTLAEFNRQRDKIIAAILAINADVYGVIEIENDGSTATSAIQDLVNGLNAATAAGTYAFADGTTPGTDEIKNSIIYKTATVAPDGAAVNDTDPIWAGQARNPLAQTFTRIANGAKFVFIVNHFTSKGCSASDTGLDADQGDGQGCDNLQRTLQAEALLRFIEARQVASGEARVLAMGDLNSYGEEDPIFRLEDDASDSLNDGPGGLIDEIQRWVPAVNRYSYQFGNQSGYLDHALASKELNNYISGATIWHINADEPTVLDYNVEFKSPAQQAINVGTPYRASDHDPVIVGINLLLPTAADGTVAGRITDPNGLPIAGAVVKLTGTQNRKFITDANGDYRFENVEANGFYSVRPSLVNHHFSPESRSFSQIGNNTNAAFIATRDSVAGVNLIESPEYFVRQHYLDFLGREPDESGFNFWSDQILSCGSDADCIERRTINVSAAYFLSIEFQETGGLVDGLYRASYGRAPRYAEFIPDARSIAQGVRVGSGDWAQNLMANKQAFAAAWVERSDFRAAYDGLTNAGYVDTLISHMGVSFSDGERDSLVTGLEANTLTRAEVLLRLAENDAFVSAKRNETFVMMQYFGYLRRDPDASGYQFWLNKLNQFGGNFEQAEMVKAFIVSGEYRARFPR